MAKRNATSSRSSSLTAKSDDRSDSPLNKTVKRRRMCVIPSYKSPLAHFRKSNLRSRTKPISGDLDDSIVLVEEVTGLPLSNDFTSSTGPKKCTATPDESVIILSDNEENLVEKETDVQLLNFQTLVEDDLSGEHSKPAEVGKVRRKIQPRVKLKTITSRVTLSEKKSSTSGLCPELNTVEPQSISIDSEDENTSPNDDSSRSHPQAEIIIIDNSLIDKSNDVSMSTISSSFSSGDSSRMATTQDDISVLHKPRKELQTAAEQFASLSLEKRNEKCGTCPVFCIDTKGDPSLASSILKAPSAKRRKVNRKTLSRNTNWATFENNKSSRRLPIKKLNVADSQARVGESENCRRAETTVSSGPLGSMVEEKLTVVRNGTRVDGIGSFQGKDTSATNGTTERLHPHKMSVASSQSEADVTGSSGKTAMTDESSETLRPKKMRSCKVKARHNAVGSYYSEQTIVNTPGSLREIIIDGCNIATQYTKGQYFSEEGLKLVIDYFKLRGHTVKAFVPQHVRSSKNVVLERLYTDGVVVFTPSRLIGGKRISSYDDRYILDYAAMSDGIVVSQDQYRDLYTEKLEWRRVIEERLLVPTFVGKCVMFPEDPLGRRGPTLDRFLRH